MSKSSAPTPASSHFDEWVSDEFARTEGFTALVVLVAIRDLSVTPLRSTFFHIVGDDIDWTRVSAMFAGAGVGWDGAVFHARSAGGAGPLSDEDARAALRVIEREIMADRMTINDGHFFDNWGRRMKIEETQPQ